MNETNDLFMDDDFLVLDEADFAEETETDGNQTEEEETAAEDSEVSTEDVQTEEPAEEQGKETPAAEEKQESAEDPDAGLPEKITIKHLKGEMDIAKQDIRATLQKGVDYDRVQNQRDAAVQQLQEQAKWRQENENTITLLQNVAKQAGTSVEAIVRQLRINAHRGTGATEAEALAKVEKEDAEAKLTMMQNHTTAQQKQEQQRQDRARAEFMEFTQRFPGVRLENVPQSVIQKSANGEMSLANAYLTHLYEQQKAENQRLQQSLDARAQNEKNKQRSLGSVKSSGNNKVKDDFLLGFDTE
jgi:hypothetical protein